MIYPELGNLVWQIVDVYMEQTLLKCWKEKRYDCHSCISHLRDVDIQQSIRVSSALKEGENGTRRGI